MAKAYRMCPSCSDATITFVARNRKEVERYADYKIENGHACDACLAHQREAESARAAEANFEAGLPALKGTEKQIAWAEKLRSDSLACAEALSRAVSLLLAGDKAGAQEAYRDVPVTWRLNDYDFSEIVDTRDPDLVAEATLAACSALREQVDAGWWIDHRASSLRGMLPGLRQAIIDRVQGAPSEGEMLEEVAVKPASPVTTEVVEVSLSPRHITARLLEKHEDFRALMKGLNYRWDGDSREWALTVGATLGTPEDRAAELMHKLLAAGFIVACQRAEVREKALNGSYEPIYPRWIAWMKSGRFAGYCQVIIRDSLDIEDDLDRLGARADYYNDHACYIRPGRYAALRDLAEIHGFRITPGADEALSKAQRDDEARLLAKDLPETPRISIESREPGREIPDGIDPELTDD